MSYRFIPQLADEEIRIQQEEGLRRTVRRAWNSPQYSRKLRACGLEPDDAIGLDDLSRLPTVDVDDLREGYPLPLLCVPPAAVVRVHASSGTTGKRKILAYTAADVETFNLQMARCYELAGLTAEDRMQIAVGYGLWTAGVGFQGGSEKLGMLTVPVGPGNLEMHLQLLQDLESTCFGATASMALLLAEEVERANLGGRLRLRKMICGSEARSEKMRQTIESKLGLEGCHDIAGMTEMYGPGTAIDCDAHDGLHYWADLFIIEVLDPVTLQPVPEGEVGEMVVTSLRKEAVPLLRYRTHDLCRLLPGRCACGLNMPRHDRILGRSDDMLIYRGVNIYPGQFMAVIGEFAELGGEYQVELSRDERGLDHLALTVERAQNACGGNDPALASALEKRLHKAIMARMDVSIVDYAALPRTFSKSRRVVDKR
ncbi:phenylacetate--CoA ligase [Desulfovibrio sp.]|uniref:phenylacetate--CoA ligase family protein n=1 Tax=Desulfovibrio sp. TaxID=885 RepID=UPI0025C24FEC|nr:phenylacetate--CoA ligase [Desulfovibrio sp.]